MKDPRGLPPPGQGGDLAERFARRLTEDGTLASRAPASGTLASGAPASGSSGTAPKVVVALSGGLDSTVLLHLLRFTPDLPPFQLLAAHFDHRMRPESEEDQHWVRGLCRAWDVPLQCGRARTPLKSEEEAREGRFGFLQEVMAGENANWILTGHHGDDQAETVLFRVIRGTGLRGLAGIPMERAPGVYRPLLPFSRADLSGYARVRGIRFFQDPTNRDLDHPRNFLRHRILPQLQEGPAPAVHESLRRLARLARENEEAWESLLPRLLDEVLGEGEGDLCIVRSILLAYHPALQTRLLREILRRSGIELDEVGTRAAMEFTKSGASGRYLSLPGGFRLEREFDRFRLGEREESAVDEPLQILEPRAGSGTVSLGGARAQVVWGPWKPEGCDEAIELPLSGLDFPLVVRGWNPGDRILLSYGTKKLKKLFAEARIPAGQRNQIPVIQDGGGRVLWVAGLAASTLVQLQEGPGTFFLGIRNVDAI